MKTLLKDMPEHMERVENNRSLNQQIQDIFDEFTDWSESRQGNVIDEAEIPKMVLLINEKVAEFVNQNYQFKGI